MDHELIRGELSRMLDHGLFSRAKGLRELAAFLFESAARKEGVDEASIAERVLGIAPEEFHPYRNANVRVQMRNLRLKLDAYYLANPEARVRFRLSGYELTAELTSTIPSESRRWLNQARHLCESRFPVDLQHALDLTGKVLDRHPEWGLAWETANFLRMSMAAQGGGSPQAHLRLADAAADAAMRFSPGSGHALAAKACAAAFLDWDWARAEALYDKAILLDPSVRHQSWRLLYLNSVGQPEEAARIMQDALCTLERPPRLMQTNLGISLYLSRRVEDAERELQRAQRLNPEDWSALAWLAVLNWHEGHALKAVYYQTRAALRARRSPPGTYFEMANEGLTGSARVIHHQQQGGIGDLGVLVSATALHQWNRAVDAMERMLENRYPLALFVPHAPFFDPLWRIQRFRELVGRVGLPEPAHAREKSA